MSVWHACGGEETGVAASRRGLSGASAAVALVASDIRPCLPVDFAATCRSFVRRRRRSCPARKFTTVAAAAGCGECGRGWISGGGGDVPSDNPVAARSADGAWGRRQRQIHVSLWIWRHPRQLTVNATRDLGRRELQPDRARNRWSHGHGFLLTRRKRKFCSISYKKVA